MSHNKRPTLKQCHTAGKRINKAVDKAIDKMVTFLTESHLDNDGGYPYDWAEIGDEIVIAELDPAKDNNSTLLSRWPIGTLLAWHDEACEIQDECDDWEEALYETMPSQ